jgi:hypothetical protein
VSRLVRHKETKALKVCCIGAKPQTNGRPGCRKTFACTQGKSGRDKQRVFSHVLNCSFVDADLKSDVQKVSQLTAPSTFAEESANQSADNVVDNNKLGNASAMYADSDSYGYTIIHTNKAIHFIGLKQK